MIKRITFLARPPGELAVPAAAPLRVTVCTPLGEPGDGPRETVVTEWFRDRDHLRAAGAAPFTQSPVVAEEAVLRGADWLEERWRSGGERFKHMAVAVRASGLTREEFSRRWRAHAGTAGGQRVPGSARGCAYAQNHCLRGPYDAVNEVWFDDLAGLRAREAWFAANPVAEGDLFGEFHFMSVRETICDSASARRGG